MPKLIINEIDNTARALGEYQNFSVVVPGFLGKGTATKEEIAAAFDDNSIIELNRLSDFTKYIGKTTTGTEGSTEAISPILSNFIKEEPSDPDKNYKTVDANDFYTTYRDCLYIATNILDPEEQEVGYLKGQFDLTGEETGTWWEFTRATKWAETTKYVYIEKGNEGTNECTYKSFGNQIAYELIKLGYTVLYKKLDDETSYGDKQGLDAMDTPEFWSCLKDKATYDFRYITTGGYTKLEAYEQIAKVATFRKGDDELEPKKMPTGNIEDAPGRGDCIALIDFPEDIFDDTTKASQSELIKAIRLYGKTNYTITENGKEIFNEYSKFFIPNVVYDLDLNTNDIYKNQTFPGSFHYLACAAKAFKLFKEWFAVSGYDRGISDYTVVGTTLTLGDLAANALQPRIGYSDAGAFNKAVNIITKIRGNYYLWGNRTGHTVKTTGLIASDFGNIRELCCSLKKVIWLACKQLTFSPNSDLLWVNFCSKIRPLLDTMKANEGIRDYAFVKVTTDKKAVMLGKIRIVPIEAVEDFELDLYLENSIEGQVVEVEES